MPLFPRIRIGQTYTVYKVVEGEKTVIGVAQSPTEAAQIIEDDMQIYDDSANYVYERDKKDEIHEGSKGSSASGNGTA